MLRIKLETELKSVDISIPSFDPQSSPDLFIIEIRHALVGMGFHHDFIDILLNLNNDDDFNEDPENPVEEKH